jgi:polysaccharide biosynthesis protein PslH
VLKILYVTPYVPSTMRIRPWGLIRELWRRGHQVTLACLVQPAWEARYLEQIQGYCQAVHPVYVGQVEGLLRAFSSLPKRLPASVAYCNSEKFRQLVTGLITSGRYDLVHTEFIRATPATSAIRGLPKTFDAVDSLSLAYERSLLAPRFGWPKRMVMSLERSKMKRYEPAVMQGYQQVLVSSPVDGRMMAAQGVQAAVLPNGVDLEYFVYSQSERSPETLLFLGKMSYYVNVASIMWFYQQVFPLIKKQFPNVRLKIVGRNPTSQVKALEKDASVEVTGTVADVRPFLAKAAVAICPMVSGSGIQNKLLEAMAAGTPSVVTSFASQAISAIPGQDLLVADTPEDFAQAILRLFNDREMQRQLGQNGRRFVEANHNWSGVGERLEKLLISALNKSSYLID